MFKMLAAGAAAAMLAGCALGVDDGGRRNFEEAFQAPVGAQEALARAQAQMQQCLRGGNDNAVRVLPEQPGGGGRVEVFAPMTNRVLARTEIGEAGAGRAQVRITMLNVGLYDADSAAALRESIEFGVPTCRSYMPRVPADKQAGAR
ncbi:hypothetical protein V8Z80_01265 [Orrella sp. JC864]|uniref:BPTD_2524 family lipoprotein n=1 Tax=Orrella sp. JC864 TaxID=3120298 RepID=UPI00300AC978